MAVRTKYEADVSQQIAAEAKLSQSASKLGQKYKDIAKSANEMERAAKKAFNDALSPADRYKQKLDQLDALLKRGRISQEQYAAAVRRVGQEFDRQKAKGTLAHKLASSQVGAMILQYGSLAAAIGLVNNALQKQSELQDKAAGITMSVASAQEGLLANLGLKVSTERRKEVLSDVSRMSREFGFNEAQFTAQFGKAFSATSGEFEQRLKLVNEVIQAAAPLHRGKQEELGTFSGTVIDTMKSMPSASAKEAVAFLLSLQEQARLTSTEDLKEFVPALASVDVTSGGQGRDPLVNAKAVGALFAAAGGRLGDVEGAQTKTLLSDFATVLREMVKDDDNVPDNFEDRIRKVVADPKLAAEVIPELKGRGASKPVIEELLRGGRVFKDWEESLDNFSMSVDETNRLIQDAAGVTPELREATITRTVGADLASDLKNKHGTAGAVRQMLFSGGMDSQGNAFPGAFELFGNGLLGTNRMAESVLFNTQVGRGADPIDQGIKALESLKAYQIPVGVGAYRSEEYLNQNPEARAAVDRANEMIEQLKGMRKDAKDANQNQRMQRKSKAVTPQP